MYAGVKFGIQAPALRPPRHLGPEIEKKEITEKQLERDTKNHQLQLRCEKLKS